MYFYKFNQKDLDGPIKPHVHVWIGLWKDAWVPGENPTQHGPRVGSRTPDLLAVRRQR